MSDFVSFILCVLVSSVAPMSTGDPDEDIDDLITEGQNLEKNIYESANSLVRT